MKRTPLFVPFTKVEPQDDGTLKVTGIASSEAEDSDGEIITADAMRAALPDYMTFGAVREMHQPIAAGTAISAEVNDQGQTEFVAHVVDPGSVKKVQTEVLKGFSIGGKITKRAADSKNKITGLKLVEISLVDRPANPDCKISLVKFGKEGHTITGTLKKGMYDISRLADIVCSLHYLTQSVQSEAIYEGDNSAMGAKLHAACESLVGFLKEMLDEESAEMLGLTGGTIAEAASIAGKHASGAVSSLEQIRTDLAELRKAANTQGGSVTDTEKQAAAAATLELTKVQGDLKTANEKLAASETEKAAAITRAETAEASLKKAEGERDELVKASAALVDSLKAKGHIRAVSKGADTGTQKEETPAEKTAREKNEKDPQYLVKQSHAKPMLLGSKPATQGAAS